MIERTAACACGAVRLRLTGEPIVSAACCCTDCQAGGLLIEARDGAPPVRDEVGATPYLIYRDDRFACVAGEDALEAIKLSPDAPTTRYVTSCCNCAMYLKHGPGWWTSVYRARVADDPPPLQFRNKTASLPPGVVAPTDIPAYRGFPPALILRLLAARVAMMWGGRTPKRP
jgi:hypothetical protein